VRAGYPGVGTVQVVPHDTWRGTYGSGTFTDGTVRKCSGTTQCLNLAQLPWPGQDHTSYLDAPVQRQRMPWFGSLMTSQRDASGQLYRRNRYYDPQSGRFTQEDPIGIAGGLNTYGFANGDPVTYSDPYGLAAEECCRFLRNLLSVGAGFVPVASELNDVTTIVTGRDVIAGEDVGVSGRFFAAAGIISPVGGGSAVRAGVRGIADQIGSGHAFLKHVLDKGEFRGLGIRTHRQFSEFIGNIMTNAKGADVRQLRNGRTAYWDNGTGTVVIHNPRAANQGTAFRPDNGRAYFDNNLR
jgi:RHS repeat-associated protein